MYSFLQQKVSHLRQTVHWKTQDPPPHSPNAYQSQRLSMRRVRLLHLHKVRYHSSHQKHPSAQDRRDWWQQKNLPTLRQSCAWQQSADTSHQSKTSEHQKVQVRLMPIRQLWKIRDEISPGALSHTERISNIISLHSLYICSIDCSWLESALQSQALRTATV